MNTRTLLAALAGGVTAFLLGWLLFGMLLMGYYEGHMIHYEGLMKPMEEMNLGLMFGSNLLFATAIAWISQRAGVNTLMGGLITGATVGLLFFASVDLGFMAMMNYFADHTVVLVDVLANTAWAAGIGAVVGLMLGRGAKAATA